MARPLRIEYPGACYHVMNRGNQRATVFRSAADYALFVAGLGEFGPLYDLRIFCYCCMPNHFHLYLRTEQANLSRFMQALLTSFAVAMNRRRRTSGHIFQGRFKAHLVEDDCYGSELGRYVHLNPVRVARLRSAPLAERRRALRTWAWSSFAATIGLRPAPPWLALDAVLSGGGRGPRRERMKAYRRYVEEGLKRDLGNPLDHLAAQTILGSEAFVDRIKRRFLLARSADRREEPTLVRLQRSFSLEQLAAVVARACEAKPAELIRRRGGHRVGRRVLMYCACRWGRRDSNLTALAARLGVSVSGLTIARDRVATHLATDRRLRRLVANIERELGVTRDGDLDGSASSKS